MSRPRPRHLVALAAVAAALAPAASLAASGAHTSSPALGSAYDVAKAGKVTLTMWWLGDQEVPGIQKWMKGVISRYEKVHPNVTVRSVIQSTDSWTQTQHIACRGKSGPDLWYNWAGTWSLEQAWQGCTVPNEKVLSPADLKHVPNIAETRWQGKTWDYPLYRFVYPIVINPVLFRKAGLNPNHPPHTWAQFLAACRKLKAKHIQPIVIGLKDGFGGEILGSATFQKQLFSNYDQLIKMVVDGDFTGSLWKSWLVKLVQLKPYFNDDTNSLNFADALTKFQSGMAAMVFGTPGVQQTIRAIVKSGKPVSVMKPPVFGHGAYADSLANTGNGFQVTSWSKHPEVAGNFMAFMHTQSNLDSLYRTVGIFPADSAWSGKGVKSPTDRAMLKWIKQKSVYYPANYYPTDLDVNGNFVVFQGILGGNMTADKAAQTYQTVIEKWRRLHQGDIENYRSWAGM